MTHLSFSSAGGAGMVASRLATAQRSLGWDASLLTASVSDLASTPWAHPALTVSAAVDEYVLKAPGFPSLFSEVRDRNSVLDTESLAAEIIHLHWINGTLDLGKATFLRDTPVFWTLHDMNPFTGGCHHSFGCQGFTQACEECPAVRSFAQALPPHRLRHKIEHYETWPRLHLVTPSAWLASEAAKSSAFPDTPITIIPNPLDSLFFAQEDEPSEIADAIPHDNTVLIVVAANLDDPIKNVTQAVAAFLEARNLDSTLTLVLVGKGGESYKTTPGVILTGSLPSQSLISLFDRADAILIPSLAENSPSVAFEAASRGVPAIVSGGGGLPDVVNSLGFGVVCDTEAEWSQALNPLELRKNSSRRRRESLRRTARELVEPAAVARRYLELYEAAL